MVEVWSLLGSLLGTLLILAATLWASKQIMQQARGLWAAVRGYEPQIIAQVDDPTDAIIAQLGRITPIPADVWAKVLPAFLSGLMDALAAGLEQPPDTPGEGA